MSDFTFRFRTRFASQRIAFKGEETSISATGLPSPLVISPRPKTVPLEEADELVFRASGFSDEATARQAAAELVSDLKRTFARLHIGADFGELAPKSGFTKAGLEMLAQDGGPRTLNDERGPIIYETGPVRFASMGPAKMTGRQTSERFEKLFHVTRTRSRPLTRKEQLAFELYGASCFEHEARARFLLLFMALETLIRIDPRSGRARWLIDGFVHAVRGDVALPEAERRSLEGGLIRLRDESIGSAGARYTEERLGERTYMEKSVREFFGHCTRLRGKMVHGKLAGEDFHRVGATAASLETFVGDLLAHDLLDIEL